jgi:hypothetical protein
MRGSAPWLFAASIVLGTLDISSPGIMMGHKWRIMSGGP